MRRVAVASALALATAACLEPPVAESIEIRLGSRETVVVSHVRLNRGDYEHGPAADRIARWERAIVDRTDASTRRIEALEPADDEEIVRRENGAVVEAERTARLSDLSTLDRLFHGSAVRARHDEDPQGRFRELTLTAPEAGAAHTQEERRTLRELEAWSGAVTALVRAEHALYTFLVANPSRAVPCLTRALGEGDDAALDASELALARAVADAHEGVLAALEVPPDREDTLDERVRRVFDPFPTELSVRVEGQVLEREGFVDAPDGAFAVPRRGAWNAFVSIEGRWVTPDLVLEAWREKEGTKLDPESVATRIRVVSKTPPTDAEVYGALREALRSGTTFRVRWAPASRATPPQPERPAE